GVPSKALGERAIQADQRAFGVIPAQRVQNIARGVERPNLIVAGPKRVFRAAGAEHAQAQAAVLFLVAADPVFLRAARRKYSAANYIVNDHVPIAADAPVGDRIMRG